MKLKIMSARAGSASGRKKLIVLFILSLIILAGCGTKINNSNKAQSNDNLNQAKETEDNNLAGIFEQMKYEDLVSQFNQAIIKTNIGDIKVEFYVDDSPITVNNFLNLAKQGFYDGTKFHRIIKDFMIQGGDPLSKDDNPADDGTGGPGYRFNDEFNEHKLVRGSLAMANSGPNTNGSQFFIITIESTPWLDGKHTNFGFVVEGMNVVDAIEAAEIGPRDRPLEDLIINSIELIKK